jgi:TPR repeat protein
MIKKFWAGLALIAPLAAHAGFDEGVAAYSVGDYAKAMAEFKPLAEQGDVKAEYFTGFLYHRGYGVEMDHAEAAKWFGKAAAQRDSQAQYYLGKMHEKGEGVERSLVDAHMWFSLSAKYAPNTRDAAYTREEIAKLERKMTPEQIVAAKQKMGQWAPDK